MACRHVRIPHPEIAIKLQSVLEDDGGNFEYEFNDGRSIVTIYSSDLRYLLNLQEKVQRWVSKMLEEIGVTSSFPVHCAIIPLLGEEVMHKIRQLEAQYDVKVTLTDYRVQVKEVAEGLLKLKGSKSLFETRDIKNVIVPVYSSESRGINVTAPAWHWSLSEGSPATLLPVSDSSKLEDVFQYGGMCVKLQEEDYFVNFKERKLKSKSGSVRSVYRTPDCVDVPQQKVKVIVRGLEHSLVKAKEDLLNLFDGHLIVTEDIQWSCSSASSPDIQQQVKNFVRQFCVLFEICSMLDGSCMLKLKGAPGYVELVHQLMEQKIPSILEEFSPNDGFLSPLLKSPSTPCPRLWETHKEKCALVDIAQDSREWNEVFAMMKKTLPNSTLIKLERIQNADLWERYRLEGKQMSERNEGRINEKYLFHGSSQVDPHKIATSAYGIDFRYNNSSTKKSLMWGQGAYFAENFSYSNMYAYKLPDGCKRQILLVSVLTGNSFSFGSTKCPELTKPPIMHGSDSDQLYDTVNGETGGSTVYVVYDHGKTCPAYVLTYTVQTP